MIRSVSFFLNYHVEDETELRQIRLPEEQLGGSYCHDPDKRLRKFLNLETEREVSVTDWVFSKQMLRQNLRCKTLIRGNKQDWREGKVKLQCRSTTDPANQARSSGVSTVHQNCLAVGQNGQTCTLAQSSHEDSPMISMTLCRTVLCRWGRHRRNWSSKTLYAGYTLCRRTASISLKVGGTPPCLPQRKWWITISWTKAMEWIGGNGVYGDCIL